jgi:uncharacterized protein
MKEANDSLHCQSLSHCHVYTICGLQNQLQSLDLNLATKLNMILSMFSTKMAKLVLSNLIKFP